MNNDRAGAWPWSMNFLCREGDDCVLWQWTRTPGYSLDGAWYWDLENPESEWMSPLFWEVLLPAMLVTLKRQRC